MNNLRKSAILLLLSITLVFSLGGCKSECNKEALFLEEVGLNKNDDVNKTMKIDYLNGEKVIFRAGDYQQFDTPLFNLRKPIKFLVGESEYFYIFDEAACEWNLVKNDITHFGDDVIVEPVPNIDILWIGSNMFIDASIITAPTTVRVLVKGYYLDEDGEIAEPIAAFMDVIIEP
ncbi:MAG: hypothetical protein KBA03_02145 [Anaerolineaceae bacterium]|nr:hypothetical protein [Anaerolineaceae bacterium]